MNAIVHANKELFKEATKMCEALLELMKDELEESKKAGRIEGEKAGRIEGEKIGERNIKINLIRTKLSKGKSVEVIAEDLEDSVENILTLIKEMDKKEENK